MSAAVLDKPPCTHREETPVRSCANCGAYLRTGNESTQCSPCGTPAAEIVDEQDIFKVLAEAPLTERSRVFEALERVWEATP
jgi:Zn finger protein HypA/HybF involved in hydrogenase expression